MLSLLLLYAIFADLSSHFYSCENNGNYRLTFFAWCDIIKSRGHTNNGRRFVSAPTVHSNRWEVIALDSFVTFRDLLEIGTFLISLATFITSLCKNHNNRNHKKTKK